METMSMSILKSNSGSSRRVRTTSAILAFSTWISSEPKRSTEPRMAAECFCFSFSKISLVVKVRLLHLELGLGCGLGIVNFVLEFDHRFQNGLGPRGAAGNVDVDRDDLVDSLHGAVVIIETARGSADTHGNNPLG